MTEFNPVSFPDPNDRIMAALAHITVIMPFWGLIVPVIIWITQKEKSKFVVFQAIQAAMYQLLLVFAYFLGMLCYMVSFFSVFIFLPFTQTGSEFFPLPFIIPMVVIGFLFLGYFIFIIYAGVAVVMIFQGKEFHYILIGNWLERFLSQDKKQVGLN